MSVDPKTIHADASQRDWRAFVLRMLRAIGKVPEVAAGDADKFVKVNGSGAGLALVDGVSDDELPATVPHTDEAQTWDGDQTFNGALDGDGVEALFAMLHVRDEKASGNPGGTFTNGAWRTRDLNTVATNGITGASLSSNQVTLPAGVYRVWARAPAFDCSGHKTRLRDTTAGADLIIGSNQEAARESTAESFQPDSIVMGQFTLSEESVLELQHRCEASRSPDGFGRDTSVGVVEVYAEAMFWRIVA